MFSGIIDTIGEISEYKETKEGICLKVVSDYHDLSLGESVAINGVCLTVTDHKEGEFTVDIVKKTLEVTTF